MATRQYVGARYVPKFSNQNGGVWNNTYSYEALEIVKHGNDFYTAKIPVPTGIDILNTTYWIKTGDYNGAINTLDAKIDQVKDESIPNIEDRYFLFMGDSYDRVTENGWSVLTASYMGVTNYERRSAGGRGFAPSSPSNSWKQYLIDNPVDNPNSVTDIVICGGTNDYVSSDSAITTGMQEFKSYVESIYPNLKRVYCGWIGWSHNLTHRPIFIEKALVYKRIAIKQGWHFLNGCDNILKNVALIDDNGTDYAHPTSTGCEALAVGIADAVKTGCYNTRSTRTTTFVPSSDYIFSNNFTMRETLVDGNITMSWADFRLNFIQAASVSEFEIAHLSTPLNTSMGGALIPCNVVNINTGVIQPCIIYQKTLGTFYMIPEGVNSPHFANGDEIKVCAGTYTAPIG